MRMTSLVAAMSTVVLVACSKEGSIASDSTGSVRAAPAGKAVAAAASTLTDANIFALLDEANTADSSAGRMASTKGTSVDVRAFGVMMTNDHHALRKGGQELATALGVAAMPPTNDALPAKAQAMTDTMTAMEKGAAWDKWYIDHEVMMHQEVLAMIDAALASAQAARLKEMLGRARPNIESHLKRAQDIQSKLPAGSTT